MVVVAGICIVGACLLTSPYAFSQEHQNDGTLLSKVVSLLGLSNADGTASAYPTLRGVEIRDLFFHIGAAALMLLLGIHLLASKARPRMTTDDLFDLRHHATSPYFWWALLLFVSAVSSYFSHAPDIALGGVLLRMLTFGWWLPLALVLTTRQASKLATVLAIAIALTALLGIWYFLARTPWTFRFPYIDGGRLRYPVGNELWFGACLLPAIFVGTGWLLLALKRNVNQKRAVNLILAVVILISCFFALYITRSRSAVVGVFAGICFAIYLIAPKNKRMIVVLVSILIALGGALYAQQKRVGGKMGERAHSIRTRLNHEWPYALTLWFAKPVGGHGEGGYTMQAGQMARAEQLQDPNTIASDEWAWTVEAHNEYLQLLADVGIAGTLGFVVALVVTLFWTVRFVDARRDAPDGARDRALAIGLGAAVIAIAFEEGTSVGLRHPGLPPLFFTAWACLWALVRSARPEPKRDPQLAATDSSESTTSNTDDRRLPTSTLRLGGVIAALAAIGLGFAGIQNWRAARAQFDADHALREGRLAEAAASADWAGQFGLDPMRKLVSRNIAIEARVVDFARRVENATSPLSDDDMRLAQDATIKSTELYNVAPRFLGLSRLKWQLALSRSYAHLMRKERELAQEYRIDYLNWLSQCRQDEPFNLEYVALLWRDYPEPAPLDRLQWLRAWLRRNFMAGDPAFGALLQSYAMQIPSAKEALDAQLQVASDDLKRDASEWKDELSPETFRISATITAAQGNQQAAVEAVTHAIELYETAGARLFYGHAAAILELTDLQFRANPSGDPAPLIENLVHGVEVMDGPIAAENDAEKTQMPLPRDFGQLRLAILLANNREAEARDQLKALAPNAGDQSDALLAGAYARLANQMLNARRHDALVERWIARAESLAPDAIDPLIAKLRHALSRGLAEASVSTAKQLVEKIPQRGDAFALLNQIEAEFPQNAAWSQLRVSLPDYPPLPEPTTQPAPIPTSQPSTRPSIDESGNTNSTSDE